MLGCNKFFEEKKIRKRNLEGMIFISLNRVLREGLADKVNEVGNEPHRCRVGLRFEAFQAKSKPQSTKVWECVVYSRHSQEPGEPGADWVRGIGQERSNRGPIMMGLIWHFKDLSFYSEWEAKPLQESKLRKHMIWLTFLEDHSGSWGENTA